MTFDKDVEKIECKATNCKICEKKGINCTVLKEDEKTFYVKPLSDFFLELCFKDTVQTK